ncbi:hypothetical protein Cri9333_0342 [Crinalium epipsammum PCC 9333]|uniref:Uncharacterized protein n=1 Tax=Crinalium epipsammum PCC 9333 TaxID=1173022 RepID=K9VUT8_9CYAN|nr:hypothetical protein [Crinalium epipsammum]AFZ11324.1 hypothetical protein Cri9333_0342 [Crinalium epipsammum PCC 9333]
MRTISYRIETRLDQVFEGQHNTQIDISSLIELGKLHYPKTNNQLLVWDKLTCEIMEYVEKNNPDFRRDNISKEIYGLDKLTISDSLRLWNLCS